VRPPGLVPVRRAPWLACSGGGSAPSSDRQRSSTDRGTAAGYGEQLPSVAARLLGRWSPRASVGQSACTRRTGEAGPVERASVAAPLLGPWSPARVGQVKLGQVEPARVQVGLLDPWNPRAPDRQGARRAGEAGPVEPASVEARRLGAWSTPTSGR
jgi:hypothetical protein